MQTESEDSLSPFTERHILTTVSEYRLQGEATDYHGL